MILYSLETPIIRPGDDIAKVMLNVLKREKLHLEDGDVIVIAESAVATSQGRIKKLDHVNPSEDAMRIAKKYDLNPRIVEIVLQEANEVYGGSRGVLLTKKDGLFAVNAGVDSSNAPEDCVVLLPKDPQETADRIRKDVEKKAGKRIGIVIGDSRVIPLKRGVIGVALATAGIEPVEDCRGREDIFGKKLKVTFRAIADDMVSAAQILMGEADEQSPMVLIRGAPIKFTEEPQQEMCLPPEECIYMSVFQLRP
ncbi:MAG: coenzyme F420-0:L-glutamate ligase [Methanocellales archaeon]|nr:coenzyme F420-0:L-glutamate ligase [Methanocellales archaeon]